MNLGQIWFLWVTILLQEVSYAFLDASEVLSLEDSNGVIRVTEDNYKELSQGLPDYYAVLFITTSKSNKQGLICDMCNGFDPIFQKVSAATHQQVPDSKVLFLKVDVSENNKLVQDLGLTTIPHVLIFPPPEEGEPFSWQKSAFYQYEMSANSVKTPLHFADFLAKVLKVYIGINEDFEYREFALYFAVFVVAFSLFKRKVLPLIPNKAKFFCMLLSFGILMLSITGYKFTQMNSIPFIARDPKGQIMYFSGGMGWQFGIEIFTVSMMYIAMGALTVFLIVSPKSTQESNGASLRTTVIACVICYTFCYFIGCFKIKNPEYPFAY
ncbi:hypothetical protein HG536_0A05710 [Torulaspora globosa]|uniref:Thioredoxin domain-containing protein n=1 Tax=Torulaspora globosa TaxID=48254 RepID=A0A7G3ZB70_9SACH|nr:uncharacterized protein HG536_0A05710 [Torulaspora globosa]QLL30756.1 hypothetical protein HG536_0A05710 [Torulaspora globosa]